MVIDFHHHLLSGKNYAENLIREMDRVGIDYTCLSGLGIGRGKEDKTDYSKFSLGSLSPDNDDVLEAVSKYPDRLIGLGVVNLDRDTPNAVNELLDKGFKALKITRPRKPYNADEYMPIYERAQELNASILFHTGMILTTCFDEEDDVCSDRMRPMLLDRVARHFPQLRIVIAHMGYPWFDEAATMTRYHKNVFVDFTGSEYGWRNRLSPSDFQRLMFWKNAYDKVVFGTDTSIGEIAGSLRDQKQLFDLLNLSEETQRKIFSDNAKFLLNMK